MTRMVPRVIITARICWRAHTYLEDGGRGACVGLGHSKEQMPMWDSMWEIVLWGNTQVRDNDQGSYGSCESWQPWSNLTLGKGKKEGPCSCLCSQDKVQQGRGESCRQCSMSELPLTLRNGAAWVSLAPVVIVWELQVGGVAWCQRGDGSRRAVAGTLSRVCSLHWGSARFLVVVRKCETEKFSVWRHIESSDKEQELHSKKDQGSTSHSRLSLIRGLWVSGHVSMYYYENQSKTHLTGMLEASKEEQQYGEAKGCLPAT